MASIRFEELHNYPVSEVVQRLKDTLVEKKREYGDQLSNFQERWSGNELQFSFSAQGFDISGRVVAHDTRVVVEAETGWLAQGKVSEMLRGLVHEALKRKPVNSTTSRTFKQSSSVTPQQPKVPRPSSPSPSTPSPKKPTDNNKDLEALGVVWETAVQPPRKLTQPEIGILNTEANQFFETEMDDVEDDPCLLFFSPFQVIEEIWNEFFGDEDDE